MWVLAAEIVIVEALNPTYDFMKCRHLTGECMSDYIPEDELDEDMYMSLSAPFTCCSIGDATFCAAISAEAPG